MEAVDDGWSCSSNEAFEISLVKASQTGLRTIANFNPKFTYPIFGDDEQIFGYQGLKVSLKYHATDMRPHLHVTWAKKFKSIGDTEPTDIPAILKDFLPEVAFQRSGEFEAALQHAPRDWSPAGECIKELEATDGRYEVRKGSLADPAIKQLVNRIQILVPLFIEGGTFIGTQDSDSLDRWTVFFLYRKRQILGSPGQYSFEFAGYSTVYRFFHYQPVATGGLVNHPVPSSFEIPTGAFDLAELPSRSRISQFIVLPPFQGKGNAGRLYSTIFEHYLNDSRTVEITVEDPNEAFDDLRDLSDLAFLLGLPEFKNLHINTSTIIPKSGPAPRTMIDQIAVESLRLTTKIAPRQFHRVVEMHLMSKLPDAVRPGFEDQSAKSATIEQHHEYKLWKLLVKQRLYRQNKEILGQLERAERIDKLEETLKSVEFEYARLLSMFVRRSQLAGRPPNGKRKTGDENGEPLSKRAKVEDV